MATYAHVTPTVLRWAREATGYSVYDAAAKIGIRWSRLEAAEQGDDLLTLRQAERAAEEYDRPLAALFLPEPPDEEPAEAQFRRLPGAPEPPWPPEMHLLARRVRSRQEAAVEVRELLDEPPPWAGAVQRLRSRDRDELAPKVRRLLGVSHEEQESWQDPTGYLPLRHWVDAVETLGVFVMQDGSLPVEAMRGFASINPVAPAIVVNTKDDPRARAFTVIHELGHLTLAASGFAVGPSNESWCEDFAGRVLAPRERFGPAFERTDARGLAQRAELVALRFGITPLAAAVRISRYGLVPESEARSLVARIRNRGMPAERSGGGHYYRTEVARLGPSFIRLVFSAVEAQALTYPAAARLLGVKVNNFGKLRDELDERSQRA
jgi:Zn-dependent peptidase ImmA (M78 family)